MDIYMVNGVETILYRYNINSSVVNVDLLFIFNQYSIIART